MYWWKSKRIYNSSIAGITNKLTHVLQPSDEPLTQWELAMYGCVPSLLYAVKCQQFNVRDHFHHHMIGGDFHLQKHALAVLLDAVLNGRRNNLLQPLERFSTIVEVTKAKWPLVYVQEIFRLFPTYGTDFDRMWEELRFESRQNEHGLVWEMSIQISLYLRCLDASVNGTWGPFDVAHTARISYGPMPVFRHYFLPANVRTLTDAQQEMRRILEAAPVESLYLFHVLYAAFPDFDGFLIYKLYNSSNCNNSTAARKRKAMLRECCRVIGYQCKAGRAYPRHDVPPWIHEAKMLRGKSPGSHSEKLKWHYCNAQQVKAMVGYSFQDLLPDEWPEISESTDDNFD